MSIDNLKKIAILQRIKNYDNLSREDLIYTILRSESNPVESNYMKYINNNSDDKIKAKINNIRIILGRSGNIVAKSDRNKIRKNLYEIEKKQRLTKSQKEKIYDLLIKLANTLDKKESYKYSDYDDLDYSGIKDLINLFTSISNNKY